MCWGGGLVRGWGVGLFTPLVLLKTTVRYVLLVPSDRVKNLRCTQEATKVRGIPKLMSVSRQGLL